MDYVLDKVTKLDKCNTKYWNKYFKDETRDQRILIESIKDHLIPFVIELDKAKDIYDRLTKLYVVSTSRNKIYLRSRLYKSRISFDEDIYLYLVNTY